MIKKLLFLILLYSLSFFSTVSCNTTEPGENSQQLKISVEEVSSTEAWLKVSAEGLKPSSIVTINSEEIILAEIAGSESDTVLYLDSLLPNKSYSFQAFLKSDNTIKSNKVTAHTLDTTSHNVVWETFEFGSHGSRLSDVAIINENNIWAVGEIYSNDSLGQPDPTPYNAVHWDGQEWIKKRIPFIGACSGVDYPMVRTIWSFSENNIWVSNGGSIVIYDGETSTMDCRMNSLLKGIINQIFSFGELESYLVGGNGTLLQFRNNWSTINSGTSTNIPDIWGISTVNGTVVYCPVSSLFEPGDYKILQIKNNKVDSVAWNLPRLLNGVWTSSERYLYVCGWGIFENKSGTWNEIQLFGGTVNGIRGNAVNDIYASGDDGFIAHYNGATWKIYEAVSQAGYGRVDVKGSIVAVTGRYNGRGIITIGKKF